MTALIFILISLSAALLFYLGTAGQGRILGIYLVWCSIVGYLSYSGFFKDVISLPPRMLLVLIPAVIFVLYASKMLIGSRLNQTYFLAIYTLRLPVELVLYQLFLEGLVPEEMTFHGWNFDILSGVTAILILAATLLKYKIPDTLFRIWNIAGLCLLIVIVVIAIMSAPFPFQLLAKHQPNVAILAFPYTLLPALVVPIVMTSHLLFLGRSTKQD